ncbi:hypothetical protein M0657_003838 [Pyricularia oryzae]|nr:hypothetical protein M9X92_004503 [Pyricularia oryzae]KAI7926079.1 hypothetical protein M0657_003838 [Pyricularia oryzae]
MDKDTVLEDVIEEYEPANLSVEFRTTPPSSANKIFRTAKDQVSKTYLVTVAASTLIPSSAKRRCPFLKTEEEAKEHAVILCKGQTIECDFEALSEYDPSW